MEGPRKVREILEYQRRQFSMMKTASSQNKKKVKDDTVVVDGVEEKELASARRSVPVQFVVKFLDSDVASSELYSDMLLYWPFLIMFMLFFLWGRDITQNHMAAAAIAKTFLDYPFPNTESNTQLALEAPIDSIPAIDKDRNFNEISRAAHWHWWFHDVLIPQTWDCAAPKYSRQTLFRRGQMQYIGAMKLRVMLMRNDSCTLPDGFVHSGSRPILCYAKHDTAGEETASMCDKVNPGNLLQTMWIYKPSGSVHHGIFTTAPNGVYHPGGYTVEFPFNSTCEMMLKFSNLLASSDPACNIIDDKRTRFVILEWFQYSSNTDTFLVAKLMQEVSLGGGWTAGYQVRMFPVWTMKRLGGTIFDCIFFCFVLYFFYRLVHEWLLFYRRTKKILAYCFDMWNILEVVNISCFVAVFILRWLWFSSSRKSKIEFPFPPSYPGDLDSIALVFSMMIYANSVNVVLTVLKLLKYLRLNPRLNVLSRTFYVSQENIVGVLLLFVFVVTGYTIATHTLYGTTVRDFRSVNSSFSALMFLLLGQSKYDEMRRNQPDLTGVVYGSYIVLSQFLLLNFSIAILSEGFSEVIGDSGLEPLDESVLRFFTKVKNMADPRNVKNLLELRLKKKRRIDLLAEVSKYLREQLERIERESPELMDADLPMYRNDLKEWLPESLCTDLGDYYITTLWDDIVHDYGIESTSHDFRVKRDIEQMVMGGVQRVLAEHLNSVDEFHTSMAKIERHVQRMMVVHPM